LKIIVDADACPRGAMQVCRKMAARHAIQLYTVASFNHNIISDHHVTVGDGSQEADLAVINMTTAGDIVVTQDWGLAALVLGRKAAAISPAGRIYRPETMDFLLEEREVKAKLRRGGGRTRGPRPRTAEDDERFAAGLLKLIESGLTKIVTTETKF